MIFRLGVVAAVLWLAFWAIGLFGITDQKVAGGVVGYVIFMAAGALAILAFGKLLQWAVGGRY
jgi:hypothetical protein